MQAEVTRLRAEVARLKQENEKLIVALDEARKPATREVIKGVGNFLDNAPSLGMTEAECDQMCENSPG